MRDRKPLIGLAGLGSTLGGGYSFVTDVTLIMNSVTINPAIWPAVWFALTGCGIVVTIWAFWRTFLQLPRAIEAIGSLRYWFTKARRFRSIMEEYRNSRDLADDARRLRLTYKLGQINITAPPYDSADGAWTAFTDAMWALALDYRYDTAKDLGTKIAAAIEAEEAKRDG